MHAMLKMRAQKVRLDPGQRRPHGLDLGHDVDAITILLDHFCYPAHLALDPFQGGGRSLAAG